MSGYTSQTTPFGNAFDRQFNEMPPTFRPGLDNDSQSANPSPSSNFDPDQLQRQSGNVTRNKFNAGSILPINRITDGNQQNGPDMITSEGSKSGFKNPPGGAQPNSFDTQIPGVGEPMVSTNQQGPSNPFNQGSPQDSGSSSQPTSFNQDSSSGPPLTNNNEFQPPNPEQRL
ncbi:hypothetical protein CROQUDRAFT_130139 [Cronartium quercuum f. sp. fusiforme G11]|uniref:Uncharacterized protein n=1 Tax=Cronartium quercuum f. sp. fusiforme G11 TaxID=708437 RepID=A0A9P6TGM5_9BASI|nr:hypothetical protein CROQUDRAFT_130139 [Cronartium quercuum f. sp. fusiforme G11]